MAGTHLWIGSVSLAGGAFVLYPAWDTSRALPPDTVTTQQSSQSWIREIATNLFSPHPWLFCLTVGAAILAKAMDRSWLAAAAFLSGFYLMLVGSKVLLALLVGRSRNRLKRLPYRAVIRVLAVLLGFFSVLLFAQAMYYLAVFC